MKIKIYLMILCMFLILLETGCAERNQIAENSTPTAAEVFAIPSIPPPTSTMTPIAVLYTPTSALPILTDSQAELVFSSLADESCKLPCYLGITPGEKTRIGIASQKLDEMGAIFIGKSEHVYEDGKLYNYSYSLRIRKPAGNVAQHIRLYVVNGAIFRMDVEILGGSSNPLVFEHWDRYSIPSVLQNFGVPDVVDSDGQNDVRVLYNEIGFYIGNSGVDRETNIVCPGFQEDGTSNADLVLFDPQAKDLLTASSVFDYIFVFSFVNGRIQINTQNILPVEDFLGITAEQFYKQMMVDPSTCFKRLRTEP